MMKYTLCQGKLQQAARLIISKMTTTHIAHPPKNILQFTDSESKKKIKCNFALIGHAGMNEITKKFPVETETLSVTNDENASVGMMKVVTEQCKSVDKI